eukprot:CAMPEP_0184743504 /NCGR_PEP_ID=MMETSP0315-20130426/6394_1 /TAXON_ID=101924 /ORGANISM="Rhodosorus marinus, Strain UTEX LB 2760" /LENGTH=113 /DNA_ID=CAMNT_0027214841 /DNA_START=158 /DNA_END=500 /DNA_ORIENTATION=-
MLSVTTRPKPRATAREETLKQGLDLRREEIRYGEPPELCEFTLERAAGHLPGIEALEVFRDLEGVKEDSIRRELKNRSLRIRVEAHREEPPKEADEDWEGPPAIGPSYVSEHK